MGPLDGAGSAMVYSTMVHAGACMDNRHHLRRGIMHEETRALIGTSACMGSLREQIRSVARGDFPVLFRAPAQPFPPKETAMRTIALAVPMLALCAGVTAAATLAGVMLPDTVTVGGSALTLNGIGIREASVFKVNVYVMGLYVDKKTGDADGVISSPGNKRVVQQYVRDLQQKDLLNGWTESFKANNATLEPVKKEYDTFLSHVVSVRKGEKMIIDFVDDRVEVTMAGKKKPAITGTAFQKALLRVWLGPKPVYPPLKKALLGGG